LIVNEVAFEFFPLHVVVDIAPIAPETEVMLPCGGLNTKTSTVPGWAISVAVMAATNSWLLTKLVTRREPFQLSTESRRKSLPLTVNRNWLPPAVALLGEMEVMDGTAGQVPQEGTVASVIANTDTITNVDALAIGLHIRQLADDIEKCSGRSGRSVDRWDCGTSQLVRQILYCTPWVSSKPLVSALPEK
jgi:hypothetical protein